LSARFELAVLGADEPLAEALLARLDELGTRVDHLHALALGDADTSVSLGGRDWPCHPAQGFKGADAVVAVSRSAAAQRWSDGYRAAHPAARVLTLDAIEPAPAVAVARVLGALGPLAAMQGADAFLTLPVAYAGRNALDELLNQTRGLFNMESPEPETFPLQVAFNLVPRASLPHLAQLDEALDRSARRLHAACPTAFTVAWGPLVYGAALALHVHVDAPVTADAVRSALRACPGVILMEAELPAGDPSPATDAHGSGDVFVGRVRVDATRVRIWLVFDPLALEAHDLARLLENWIDHPAASMLT
jgi:aspartate-semialdehyde dehydrogenase